MRVIPYTSFCDLPWEEISIKWHVKLILWSTTNLNTHYEKGISICFQCCNPLRNQNLQGPSGRDARLYVKLTPEDVLKIRKKFSQKRLGKSPLKLDSNRTLKSQLRNFEIAIWNLERIRANIPTQIEFATSLCSCSKPLIVGVINSEFLDLK